MCELTILQTPWKTLTIEKLSAYHSLTKNNLLKINKIESHFGCVKLVFTREHLAKLDLGSYLPRAENFKEETV